MPSYFAIAGDPGYPEKRVFYSATNDFSAISSLVKLFLKTTKRRASKIGTTISQQEPHLFLFQRVKFFFIRAL